jgi:hypothetical protein
VSIVRPPTVISGFLVGLSGAAQNRADSGGQLGCGERFDHVVVGAEVEQPDDLGFVVPVRSHNGGDVAHAAQHGEHVDPVDVRQPEIEEHDVGSLGHGRREGAHTGCRPR